MSRYLYIPLAHSAKQNGFLRKRVLQVNRDCEPPDEGLMTEMLWSDPQPGRGRAPSKRGVPWMRRDVDAAICG